MWKTIEIDLSLFNNCINVGRVMTNVLVGLNIEKRWETFSEINFISSLCFALERRTKKGDLSVRHVNDELFEIYVIIDVRSRGLYFKIASGQKSKNNKTMRTKGGAAI